jgi:hypothetical protein
MTQESNLSIRTWAHIPLKVSVMQLYTEAGHFRLYSKSYIKTFYVLWGGINHSSHTFL